MQNKRLFLIVLFISMLVFSTFIYGCKPNPKALASFSLAKTIPKPDSPTLESKDTLTDSLNKEAAEKAKKLEEQKLQEEQKKLENAKKEEAKKQAKSVDSASKKITTAAAPKPKTNPLPQQTPVPAPTSKARLIDKLKAKGNSEQVILVQASSYGTYKVTVNTYEKVNGSWKEVLTNVPGVIGRKGFSTNRHEGDYTSPVGAYHFPYFFGWGGNAGFKMPYKPSTNNDFWISLGNAESYNVWLHREDGPDLSWQKNQYEILGPATKLYKYAAVMNFNMGADKIVGKGSGIFLHIKPSSGLGTAGCTAIPEDKLLQVLKWMEPSKNPVIIQGTTADLENM